MKVLLTYPPIEVSLKALFGTIVRCLRGTGLPVLDRIRKYPGAEAL